MPALNSPLTSPASDALHQGAAPSEMDVLQQFRLIFRAVKRHFQSVEEACGVSGAQLWALARIAAQPGLKVGELAKALAVHQTTASNLVDRLCRAGLVERRRSTRDQRVVELYPSRTGSAALGRAPEPLRGVLPDALAAMAPAKRLALSLLLTELTELMGEPLPGGAADAVAGPDAVGLALAEGEDGAGAARVVSLGGCADNG